MDYRRLPKRAGLALLVLLVLSQAVRPARTNPPIHPDKTLLAMGRQPADVGAIFARACNDCHSSLTRWPWYSNVAPISWMLADHVKDGRRELSFSTWGDYDERRKGRKLQEICTQVREGEMPPWSYVLLHADAKLVDDDRQVVCRWADAERARLSVASGATRMPREGSERERPGR